MFSLRSFLSFNIITSKFGAFHKVNRRGQRYCFSSCISHNSVQNVLKFQLEQSFQNRAMHLGVFNYQKSGYKIQRDLSDYKFNRKTWLHKKKKSCIESQQAFKISAYATAYSYNIEPMTQHFNQEGFSTGFSSLLTDEINSADILKVESSEQNFGENKNIYIFKEGMIVFWNFSPEEQNNLLLSIEIFENDSYSKNIIFDEHETLNYVKEDSKVNKIESLKNMVTIPNKENCDMEKYTISHALAMSVKLGILETYLSDYVNRISQYEDIYNKEKAILTRDQVQEYIGELCNLKHYYNNLEFSYLPDFCWEDENLEILYYNVLHFLDVRKRSTLICDRLESCIHLMELLRSQYDVSRSHRLEFVIVVLIFVEILIGLGHAM